MKKIYTLIILIILFMSCRDMANDAPFIEPTPDCPLTADEIKSLEVTHVMPYEEALKEVTDFMDQSSTRSSNRTISEVRVIENTARTRAADSGEIQLADTTLYIFNFADDQGFAIVSADSRSEGLLAFAESGNFTDSITNPGLAIFYSRIEAYQLEAARHDKALKDSLYEQAREKMERLSPGTRSGALFTKASNRWIYKERKELPMITKWGQEYPYNIAIPYKNGSACYAGCIPVAVAQLAAYHRFPENYNGSTTNLVLLAQYVSSPETPVTDFDKCAREKIAFIIYNWGKEMGTTWGSIDLKEGSSTYYSRITGLFRKLGYSSPGVRQGYNLDIIINSLKNNNPCLIDGTSDPNKSGHEWIIEGYSKEYRYVEVIVPGEYSIWKQEYRNLVRCNYGWNGWCDGYYLSEVFDTNTLGIEPGKDLNWVEPNVPFSKNITPGFYQYNLNIIPDIHR